MQIAPSDSIKARSVLITGWLREVLAGVSAGLPVLLSVKLTVEAEVLEME